MVRLIQNLPDAAVRELKHDELGKRVKGKCFNAHKALEPSDAGHVQRYNILAVIITTH